MYLPSSVVKIQQNNFVSLPEEDISVTHIKKVKIYFLPHVWHSQLPVQRAFLDLEKGLGNRKHTFFNRYIE